MRENIVEGGRQRRGGGNENSTVNKAVTQVKA